MSSRPISFAIEKKLENGLGRAGVLKTPHGDIETPTLTVAATKGTVKALTSEQIKELGTQAILANTYHLYLQPGVEAIEKAGGLHRFMHWDGPLFTDSGGFQVLSLGTAFGTSVTKISKRDELARHEALFDKDANVHAKLAKVDEEGVTFLSHIDGSTHRFTAEFSMDIQHKLGGDVMFAFDEAPASGAGFEYQKASMERTHRWAQRSLEHHRRSGKSVTQALFGIVQGGRFEDLRKESAKTIAAMSFDGYGIGGSYVKEDIQTAVRWVTEELPEDRPRHLLGIGEPEDMFLAVEAGVDTFDCVSPTRLGRNGTIYTKKGKVNITSAIYRTTLEPIDDGCECYTCRNYTKAYLNHLFRAKEMLAATLASIHNLFFIVSLLKNIRGSIIDGDFDDFRGRFLSAYRC